MMVLFIFDGTFEGLLTAVFEAYARKRFPDRLAGEGEPPLLFVDEVTRVATDAAKADRVWRGLERRLSRAALSALGTAWLSELPDIATLLFRYIRKAFDAPVPIETDFGDADVLRVTQIWKKVRDEREKTLQFLRFQKAADGTYFAATAPRYDTLPLVVPYALDRFADQRWLIYDVRRDYGYYYDLREATEVRFEEEDIHLRAGLLGEDIMDKDERLFQAMWKAYFQSTAIRERLNPRLQRQHMPARFWRFLPEKR